jgi:hypothetical protein
MRNRRASYMRVVAIAGLLFPWKAAAQGSAASGKLGMAGDAEAARTSMGAIMAQLSDDIVHAGQAASITPWKFTLPAGDSWKGFETNVLRVLRGRYATTSDSAMAVMIVEELQMHGDTLVTRFYLGGKSMCRGEWKGSGTEFEMRAIRVIDWFKIPITKPVLYSDSIPCTAKQQTGL